tara:strand:+ start:9047 stop:11602 length:2556 start_codon:yes stop_codon:yes gene_type:complete
MAKKQPKKKKDINKKIVDATVNYATDPVNQALMMLGPVGMGAGKLGKMALKTKVGQKVLKSSKAFLSDLKILRNRQAGYQSALKNRNAAQIKDSKYLTEKQNSLNAVTSEIDQLEKLTKNKSFNFNKVNDYSVKKYNHGGTHAYTGPALPKGMPNIPAPSGATVDATDMSISARMKRGADKIANFSMAPGGSSHGAPTQILAEMTGVPSLLRLPQSYKNVKEDPSGKNIFKAAANTFGVIPGATALTKGAGPLLTNANRVLKSAPVGMIGNLFKANKLKDKMIEARDGGMRYYQGGGVALPGGEMQPIPGSDAVEFAGASHEQGGIELDPQTEVEGGETMDQVTMRDGGKSDYFFSEHLKHGGMPFSARHKQILAMGGSQEEIDNLAQVQEQAAGRNPQQVAGMGGKRLYAVGGIKGLPEDIASNISSAYYSDDPGEIPSLISGSQYYSTDKRGGTGSSNSDDIEEIIENVIEQNTDANVTIEKTDKKNTKKESVVTKKDDVEEVVDTVDDISPVDNTKEVQENTITDPGVYGDEDGNYWKLDKDGNWQVMWKGEHSYEDGAPLDLRKSDGALSFVEGLEDKSSGDTDSSVPYKRRRGSVDAVTGAAMAGQFLPAMQAMSETPDYINTHEAAPGNVAVSADIGRKTLDRVNMNTERERNAADYRSMNRFIENSGLGPAGMANRMAAYARKQAGDREIGAKEAQINAGISNQEAQINTGIDKQNVANMMANSQFNARQQNAINMFNAGQTYKTDEFNRGADAATKDRRLMGLQSAMTTMAGINRDRLAYEAQDRMAQAISGNTGVLSREELARDLAQAYPDLNPGSEEFQKMTEDTYLKMLKNNQNKEQSNG